MIIDWEVSIPAEGTVVPGVGAKVHVFSEVGRPLRVLGSTA